jgi:hypothetical protein
MSSKLPLTWNHSVKLLWKGRLTILDAGGLWIAHSATYCCSPGGETLQF